MKKYIVYLTINIKNNKVYVGVHKTENPEKFDGYLGCGVNINDKHSYKHSKTPFQFAVNKYGIDSFRRTTLKEFDSYEEALEFESLIVNEEFVANRNNYNAALGGGIPPIMNKLTYQYDKEGNFIKEWFSIVEASLFYNVSDTSIGMAIINKTVSCNFLWTNFKVDKVDITTFHFASNKKVVHKYNSDGKFEESYTSYADAGKLNNCDPTSISAAIKGGHRVYENYYSDILVNRFDIARKQSIGKKAVHRYTLEGEYVDSFISIADACKQTGTDNTTLSKSIKNNKTANGHQWSFEKLDKISPIVIKIGTESKRVGQYNLAGELTNIYSTVRECQKDFSKCSRVLKGEIQYTKGYTFKYI